MRGNHPLRKWNRPPRASCTGRAALRPFTGFPAGPGTSIAERASPPGARFSRPRAATIDGMRRGSRRHRASAEDDAAPVLLDGLQADALDQGQLLGTLE